MKRATLFSCIIATTCLSLTASARSYPLDSLLKSLHFLGDQSPLITPPNPAMPPSSADNPNSPVSTGVIISDVIGKLQDIAIFNGLTRDIDSVANRLEDSSKNATVLAPTNAIMRGLERKPWEDPKDYNTFGKEAYALGAGEDRAHRNLRLFVEAHIVPESPWEENHKIKTLKGTEVWYEVKDGKKIIQPKGVEVVTIAEKVGNGEVWILNGVLN